MFPLQSLAIVDCPELRDLLLYIGTNLQDKDIPHRTKVCDLILQRFNVEYNKNIERIKVCLYSSCNQLNF